MEDNANQYALQNDPQEYRGEGQSPYPNHPTNDSGEMQEAIADDAIENRDLLGEIERELRRFGNIGHEMDISVWAKVNDDGTVTISDSTTSATILLDEIREELPGLPDDISQDDFWHRLHQLQEADRL